MLVEEHRWLNAEEFSEMLSLCQVLPGPNIVNMAVCVGTRFRGARGAIAAFLGLLSAPFAIILVLGALFTHYGELPAIAAAFRGISAAAAGLIVAMGLKMAASRRLRSPMAIFALAAFVSVALLRMPLGLFLLMAAPASVAAAAWRRR
jgi:chromate transporter